eukprot:726042-Pyramimonas_sp.AAC.1
MGGYAGSCGRDEQYQHEREHQNSPDTSATLSVSPGAMCTESPSADWISHKRNTRTSNRKRWAKMAR